MGDLVGGHGPRTGALGSDALEHAMAGARRVLGEVG